MSSPDDLVSLADVQNWLGQTSDGPLLAALITQTSRAVLSYIGRPDILPTVRSEIRDGDGHAAMVLRHWPALEVESLEIDGRIIAPAESPAQEGRAGRGYILEPPDHAPPGRMQTLWLHGAFFSRGAMNVRLRYAAGYRVKEYATVPASPGPYVVAARQELGAFASDEGVSYASGGALPAGAYSVENGVYSFTEGDAGRVVVMSYGYVPADLAQAAMEWTAERYAYRSRIGQRSKSLGGQETASFDLSATPPFVAALLQPYRRTVWPC